MQTASTAASPAVQTSALPPQQLTTTPINIPPLNDGEVWIGIISIGLQLHHVILLPGDFDGDHAAMLAKAAELGGDLPSRVEQALLFAQARDQFKRDWYWSNEKHASGSGYAWCQVFYHGDQSTYHTDDTLRARAVRRVVIQ